MRTAGIPNSGGRRRDSAAEESEGSRTDMELRLGLEGRDPLPGSVRVGLLDQSGPPIRVARILTLG